MKAKASISNAKERPVARNLPPADALAVFELPLHIYLQNSNAGLLVTNSQHHCIWANEVMIRNANAGDRGELVVNHSFKEVVEHFASIMADAPAFTAHMEELRRRKKPSFGWELSLANGRAVEISYIPLVEQRRFKGGIWQVVDVTRRRQADDAMRRSEEKFRVMLDNLNAALCETDLDGNIVKVYDSFCRLSGYTEQELIGQNITDLFVPEPQRAYARSLRRRRIENREALLYDMEIVLKDGSTRWVLASSANIYDREGNPVGGAGIHMDITGQKKLQEALELANRQAEEARATQKEFLASVSHEIRTPLNAIIGMMHLLEETSLDAQQQEYINILKHSSGILLGLISDILDISRIEAGEWQVNQREFDLVALVQSLRHTFELKLGRRPVKITAAIDPQLQHRLVGDDMLLNQILMNLLGNAEKFTPQGEIAISVTPESWQDDKLWIRFRVCDTGIGIQKDKLELVFRNYRQAEKEIREKYGGSGLGLAIAKHLVELQGGSISIEEMPGYNTCFSFNLPYIDTGKPAAASPGARKSRRHISFGDARVLVIEDNLMNLRYLISLLEKYQVTYQLATNGPDAGYFLDSRQYDLVLLDIGIPGTNGLELAARIRADERKPNVATPLVATTALATESTVIQARQAGITDILTKPYTPDQLLLVLNKYLNDDETTLIMEEEVQQFSGFEFHPELDVKYLNTLYENNISYAADLFEIFLKTVKEEVTRLQGLVAGGEWDQLRFSVHKLKPNFAMVGLTWVSSKMQTLENNLTSNTVTPGDVHALFEEIAAEVEKFYPVIEKEYARMRAFVGE